MTKRELERTVRQLDYTIKKSMRSLPPGEHLHVAAVINEQNAEIVWLKERAKEAGDLLDLFWPILKIRICIGDRWQCDKKHEWVTSHGDCVWFAMPTCPTCGKPATAGRGEWQILGEWTNAKGEGAIERGQAVHR